MPYDPPVPTPRQTPVPQELIERLQLAGRESSAATVAYHSALAERRGLSASEVKAIDILMRLGPLTHAQLVEHTSLRPASVTDLIDKIERKGYASRGPHPDDRRRILVTVDAERIFSELGPLFAEWFEALDRLYEQYSDDQLATIADFLARAAAAQQRAAEHLVAGE